MFFGGLIGLLIGLYILFQINKAINALGEEAQQQRDEIIHLTVLLRTVDQHFAESLKRKNTKSVNNLRAYQALIDRQYYYDDEDQ